MTELVRTLTPITSGNTFKEWIASRDPNLPKMNPLLEPVFDLIAEIPGFLDTFHRSEDRIQASVFHNIYGGRKCPFLVLSYIDLMQQTNRVSVTDQKIEWDDPQTEKKIAKFFGFIATGTGIGYVYLRPFFESAVLEMMFEKHGDDRILEVMDRWTSNQRVGTFCNFIQLVEEWDALREYPTEWGISVSRAHDCKKWETSMSEVMEKYRISYNKIKYSV